MNTCHLCETESVTELLDLGMQPICNRFLADPEDEEYTHPMTIGQCNVCGLVQIINPVPACELLPWYEWITYNEPEGHLDDLSDIIRNLPGVTGESTVCGISFKDDSSLTRLEQQGFKHAWRIDPKDDLGISNPRAGVETIQDCLTAEVASRIVKRRGTPDIVIVRHILEHAHNALKFMEALRQLVDPEGYIVVEVPDCMRALQNCDYTSLWEEHVLYFTPETFKHCFTFGDLSLVRFECYPYPFENSLVAIVQAQDRVTPSFPAEDALENERRRAQVYSEGLAKYRAELKKFFSEQRQSQGKIALFGAGHLACTFVNLLGLQDYIEFIVDDDPHKQGLLMPGSRLPIHGSIALVEKNIKLCLLSLNPLSEEKVIQKNQDFLERGGTFFSIFPGSKHALQI